MLNRVFLNVFFDTYDYPIPARKALLLAAEMVEKKPEAYEVLNQLLTNYPLYPTYQDIQVPYEKFKEIVGPFSYSALLLFFICCAEPVKKCYEEQGISLDIYQASMGDLRYKLIECYDVYGIWGSFVADWFIGWAMVDRFQLGRLQFEKTTVSPIDETEDGSPFPGVIAVGMHIPSAGPLNEENISDSIARAVAFFKDRIPGDTLTFYCESWLLYEPLLRALPETSGIKIFSKRFRILKTIHRHEDYWRIFNTFDVSEPDQLENRTSLQRFFIKRLKEGGTNGEGYGVFTVKKKDYQ